MNNIENTENLETTNKSAIEKPVSMIREEFIQNLVSLINNSSLPPFIIEPIIRDVHDSVTNAMRQALERDKEEYNKRIADKK